VNLRRMNRVLEINEEMGYAVVEPGVTWSQLYEAIEAGGHKLMVSTTDLGWGSVIGNSLEHGTTYLPYGADFQAPCGMEVVLANGEVLRTGMGALPGSKAWHLYRRGLGPTLDPLFMQSNFGVVVKMGVWLMPKPEVYAPFWAHVPRETDLVPLMDTMRRLRLDRTIEGVPSCTTPSPSRRSPESGRAGTRATGRPRTTSSTRSRATSGSAGGSCTARCGTTTRSPTTRSRRSPRPSGRSPAPGALHQARAGGHPGPGELPGPGARRRPTWSG
jgi:hypothetical protein